MHPTTSVVPAIILHEDRRFVRVLLVYWRTLARIALVGTFDTRLEQRLVFHELLPERRHLKLRLRQLRLQLGL